MGGLGFEESKDGLKIILYELERINVKGKFGKGW